MTKTAAARAARREHRRLRGGQTPPRDDRLRTVTKNTVFKARKDSALSLSSHMKYLSINESAAQELTPAQRLLLHSLSTQERNRPLPNYMVKVQKDEIKGFMRYDVLQWVLRVNKKLDFHLETMEITANLFDRLLSTVRVKAVHLQLIAATCFLVAAKMHEVWNTHPSLHELVSVSGHAFSCNDIERMEKQVLLKLGWALNPPTVHVLVYQLLAVVSVPPACHAQVVAAAEPVLERAILCERFLQYSAATQAACLVVRGIGYRWPGVSRDQVEREVLQWTQTDVEMYTRCRNDIDRLMFTMAPVL